MSLADAVLVIMLLLASGAVIAGIFRNVPIPYTVMLVLLGVSLNYIAQYWQPMQLINNFRLTPDLILFIFLPTLIFEAGLSLPARQLVKDIAPILILAIPALLISGLFIGAVLHYGLGLSLIAALLFGALISATDPVAVISLFKELGAPARLTVLVEGESLFNDATAIVVFNIVVGLSVASGFGLMDTGAAAATFIKVFFGGALVGVFTGMLASLVINRLHIQSDGILIITLALAYMSFILAEHGLHLSGVMAVAFAAITMGLLVLPKISEEADHTLHTTWEFLADICNTLLFILIGFSINPVHLMQNIDLLGVAIVLVIAARAGVIYSLIPVTTKAFKLLPISSAERHIMWWGGLKGGLAIAMVLSIPDSLAEKQLLVDLTAGVVLFTLLINAPTIRPIIHRLGIDKLSAYENHELKHSTSMLHEHIDNTLNELHDAGVLSQKSRDNLAIELRSSLSQQVDDSEEFPELLAYQLTTVGWEINELRKQFRSGFVPQIAFLDLLNEKRQRMADLTRQTSSSSSSEDQFKTGLLSNFESWLLRNFREKDWAARWLALFLNSHLTSRLHLLIANFMVFDTVQKQLSKDSDIPQQPREQLVQYYREQLDIYRQLINDIREDFPTFFTQFELNFASRASLISAMRALDHSYHQGKISTKPYRFLEHTAAQALRHSGHELEGELHQEHIESIRKVPLLSSLPEDVIEGIAKHAIEVHYLPGDIIIGGGDHGDALYIILDGTVEVQNIVDGHHLATLTEGDFFGEGALLGTHTRNANVEASYACLLLRITRKTVINLAKKYSEIEQVLSAAKQQRDAAE